MSLNWREIDKILEEIPLTGSLIRDIRQPSYPRLVLELYNRGRSFRLLLSFSNPHCRLHLLTRKLQNPARPQRFVAFLRARIRGGKIVSAGQIGRERIVRLEVAQGGQTVLLWCRLWAAAANMIVTDPQGVVLDALYRRPKRGEVSGGSYSPEKDTGAVAAVTPSAAEPSAAEPSAAAEARDRFAIRDLPGPGTFNERVERYYFRLEEEQEAKRLRDSLLARLRRKELHLEASLISLGGKLQEHQGFETYKRWGDLILSNLHTLSKGDRWLTVEDEEHPGGRLDIELDSQLSPAQNAERCYKRYRKAKAGLRILEEERSRQEGKLARTRREIERLQTQDDLAALREQARRAEKPKRGEESEWLTRRHWAGRHRPGSQGAGRQGAGSPVPGLSYLSGAFRILVGRNARENDELLRRHVRGNDFWLHARDFPGGYVFVRSIAGKSVPLETLLDAGTLALLYSKGKQAGQGDVYYTQVKFLKRVKEGKAGLVIPTREKNLHIRIDPDRFRRLKLGDYSTNTED